MTDKKIDGFHEYEIRGAANDLQRAIEITKKPKLLKLAQKELKKQAKAAVEATKVFANI